MVFLLLEAVLSPVEYDMALRVLLQRHGLLLGGRTTITDARVLVSFTSHTNKIFSRRFSGIEHTTTGSRELRLWATASTTDARLMVSFICRPTNYQRRSHSRKHNTTKITHPDILSTSSANQNIRQHDWWCPDLCAIATAFLSAPQTSHCSSATVKILPFTSIVGHHQFSNSHR